MCVMEMLLKQKKMDFYSSAKTELNEIFQLISEEALTTSIDMWS